MKRNLFAFVCVVGLVVLAANSKAGQLWRYPEDFPGLTMQDAIERPQVQSGDTISVRSGEAGAPVTYYENLNFLGKNILVASREDPTDPWSLDNPDPSLTIIDGRQLGSVVRFVSGEAQSAEIRGFTITDGRSSTGPGGIMCRNASPKINGNIISYNQSTSSVDSINGGGIGCLRYASPTITENEIHHNSSVYGAGIFCHRNSSPSITKNTISNNEAGGNGGGIFCLRYCSATIDSNVIEANTALAGGGIELLGSNATVTNNTIRNNMAVGHETSVGAGILFFISDPIVEH